MRSLTLKFAETWKNKKNINISIDSYDDILDKIPYKKIAGKNNRSNLVVAALVGVQTNQFPRASAQQAPHTHTNSIQTQFQSNSNSNPSLLLQIEYLLVTNQ